MSLSIPSRPVRAAALWDWSGCCAFTFKQHWFNLSDPAAEEALYDSRAMRRFAGIDLGNEPVPDKTTLCKFRHLLEKHDHGARLFEMIGEHLEEAGLKVRTGGGERCAMPGGSAEKNLFFFTGHRLHIFKRRHAVPLSKSAVKTAKIRKSQFHCHFVYMNLPVQHLFGHFV